MQIVKEDKSSFSPFANARVIKEAVKLIKKGGVIVCPTDTVYGLLCDATNKKAVEKVFRVKKRPKNKAVPIFIKDLRAAKKLAKIDKWQEDFLKRVWPGKVTAVLLRKRRKKLYGVDKTTIALRMPKYPFVQDLLKNLNIPLTGTSANITGRKPATRIEEVLSQFKNQRHKPDLVLDAGNLKSSKPSKVIDLTNKKPKILRK